MQWTDIADTIYRKMDHLNQEELREYIQNRRITAQAYYEVLKEARAKSVARYPGASRAQVNKRKSVRRLRNELWYKVAIYMGAVRLYKERYERDGFVVKAVGS